MPTQTFEPREPPHPGQHVRVVALDPKNMSVTAAARLLGVGRPALSNLLNGRAGMTPDMAARIERGFGVSAQRLLEMQSAYEASNSGSKRSQAKAKAYVPPFLSITANDFERWVEPTTISARARLSVLLRTLVNSTGLELSKVDFPGNDDAERPGWDGQVEAGQGTPWIPEGLSGWEFGTNKNIKAKADGDFAKSVMATDEAVRKQTSFIFVTPRRWGGKQTWQKEHVALGQWKDVRAYDASDLEQWLEQSIAGQAWFANETRSPSQGVRSLDQCWSDWAGVCRPTLVGSLFSPAVDAAKRSILGQLAEKPQRPMIVTADSSEEAAAFLSQLFDESSEELARYRDRVVIFDEPNVVPKIALGNKHFIAVTSNREVERELAKHASDTHSFVIYPRNAPNAEPAITLEPLHHEAFRKSLEEMGLNRDEITRCNNESGRSLTVLRRRLASGYPAIQTPQWATNLEISSKLLPFLLVGSWDSRNKSDQLIVSRCAEGKTYEQLERDFQTLAGLSDAPVWSVGTFRGVVSKIDLLFAASAQITAQDLRRYFDIAKAVLAEDDPSLDVPENERWWKAAHQGRVRQHSGTLRKGMAETLVLLSVYGKQLFRQRLGFDTEHESAVLVRNLLTPLTTRKLEANDRDLPTYAEATPDEFLRILEADVATAAPECFGLLRPSGTQFGSGCARTGLLWALESAAWNPDTFHRAALILARLAEVEITDNWVNKPINSLRAILRSWMPQTAATLEDRIAVLKLLMEKFPAVAWKICLDQISTGHQTGEYSNKPKWRTDGHGHGEPISTWGPILAFGKKALELALGQKSYNREMLCDLVEKLSELAEKDHAAVWHLIKSWADAGPENSDKAALREKIRISVMSRRAVRRRKGRGLAMPSAEAQIAYDALEPSDLLYKNEWLFRAAWVEDSADERNDDLNDFRKREERVAEQRTNALKEIFVARGLNGVLELAEMGQAASEIGRLMVVRVLKEDQIADLLLATLPPGSNAASWARANVIFGTLHAVADDKARARVLRGLKKNLPQADFSRILQLAPFERSTWAMVDKLGALHRESYWEEVDASWRFQDDEELQEAVERLLAASRPRAAFACVRHQLKAIDATLLHRLLSEIAKEGKEKPGHYRLDSYYVEVAFSLIDKSSDLTLEQKAGVEFAYLDVLAQKWRSKERSTIPNLEKYIDKHPELFVQALVWAYKRKQKGEDPVDWKVPADRIDDLAKRGYHLLDSLETIPGRDENGVVQNDLLAGWVKQVREAATELDRADIADICLGKLLSHAPLGSDGVWPSEPVRRLMEDVQSKCISEGTHTGLYNSRGVTWRGSGGDQERELAAKYKAWADALKYSHPFVSSTLLMEMMKTYQREADREDTHSDVMNRLE